MTTPPDPRPPIFVFGDGGLTIFRSVGDAEAYLEAVDVLDGLYVGFDADARRLSIDVPASWRASAPTGFRDRVRFNRRLARDNHAVITVNSCESAEPEALATRLRELLAHRVQLDLLARLNLSDLTDLALAHLDVRGDSRRPGPAGGSSE